MERFNRYEKEVLFEQKINEIQETNEFKLFAEEKLNEEEFKTFLVETYGEELAEGFMDSIRRAGQKAALGAAMMGLGAAAAPPAAAAPMSPTTQVAASDDQRMQVMAEFASNANSLRAAAQDDRKEIQIEAIKAMGKFLRSNGVDQELAKTIMSEVMFKDGGITTAKEMFRKHLDQTVRPQTPERKGGEEQARKDFKAQLVNAANSENGITADMLEGKPELLAQLEASNLLNKRLSQEEGNQLKNILYPGN